MMMKYSVGGMTDENVFSLFSGRDYCKLFSP